MGNIKICETCNSNTKNIDAITTAIQEVCDKGRRKFAIAPMGDWGKKTKEIMLDKFHIEPYICFDNFLFDNQGIYSLTVMNDMDLSDIDLFIVVENDWIRTYLYQQAAEYISDLTIHLITLCNAEQRSVLDEAEKIHLDFVCAGFHKCGTTSLREALMKNKHIFLPHPKETFFASSMTKANHEKLKQVYSKQFINKDSILFVGGTEPAYATCPAAVAEYFGTDLKILFCVRNPVQALKSCFKMAMREAGDDGFYLIKKYGKICPELIQEYIEVNYRRFLYIDFIHMYQHYYSESNIKVIITEELIQNPLFQMNEIQDFIGLPEECRMNYEEFPHENRGNTVFKDVGCACVNNALNNLRMQTKDADVYTEIQEIRKQVFEITTIPVNLEPYNHIWESVWDYYAESVRKLEGKLGRSLKGIWY